MGFVLSIMKNSYSFFEKFLHQITLNNDLFKDFSFELEKSLFLKRDLKENPKVLFVNGLARSGTTTLLNHLVEAKVGVSLTYDKLPFLFSPNLLKPLISANKSSSLKERAHGDNIKINERSPEALDEIFWKFQLKNKYLNKNSLEIHSMKNNDIQEYLNFIKLHLLKQDGSVYLTKNNNTILRLESLLTFNEFDKKFIFTIRDPLSHAHSLLNQHQKFSNLHHEDPFSLEYFNFLGHHEFGLNLKYFDLNNSDLSSQLESFSSNDLNYWITAWLNYHEYLLKFSNPSIVFISFDDLCKTPENVISKLSKELKLDIAKQRIESYDPPIYSDLNQPNILLERCMDVYHKLLNKCL